MHLRLEKVPVDLQDTPVENLFLDIYMPQAPGDFVKVYLLGYRYALETTETKRFSSGTIADNLSMTLDQVSLAWDYWEEKGLIRRIFSGEKDTPPVIEYLSLKHLHLKHLSPSLSRPEKEVSPQEWMETRQRSDFRQFFESIHHLLQRPLVVSEEMQILEWLKEFQMDREVILLAFEYAVQRKQIRSIPYVASIVRNWADEQITTRDEAAVQLDRLDPRNQEYRQIFKALGFQGRLPSLEEARLMDQWLDQLAFPMEMVLKACAASANTANPSIRYIHGVLERWHQEGLLTPEAVDRYEQLRKEQKKKGKAGLSSGGTSKKTGFHLPESRGQGYNNEDLEKILLGRKRRPRKGENQ